jgi:prepilin-type N-terminal cleavage/methylation domain-containing protein/prepilin-type processing-associated H-X9-DG protein
MSTLATAFAGDGRKLVRPTGPETSFQASNGRATVGSDSSGFTLIEVLVVIVIIAVLAALITPIVIISKTRGKQSACLSNMREIGTALQRYASDNDGNFPETTHSAGVRFSRAWIFTLKPYLANCDKVRISPADPHGAERLRANGTSYVLNSYVFVPQVGPFGEKGDSLNNVNRLPYPARTILAFNVSDQQPPSVMNDHTHSERWLGNWNRFCGDTEPNRHRTESSNKDHTNGSANYLYADGHVEAIEAAEVKRRIDRGVPFAKPPLEPEDLNNQ